MTRRRGRRVARLPAVIPRPASMLDQMAIWTVASEGFVSISDAVLGFLSREMGHTEEIRVSECADEGNSDDDC